MTSAGSWPAPHCSSPSPPTLPATRSWPPSWTRHTEHYPPRTFTQIPVDLEALADLLDGGPESAGGRVDLVTGEVWPDLGTHDPGLDDEQEELEDEDRWLLVDPIGSRSAYRDMLNFIATRTDRDLIGRLEVAVDGPGAFRRFKNVLSDWPEDRDDWFEYSDERRRGRARAWLADEGYQPAIQPKPQSPDDPP